MNKYIIQLIVIAFVLIIPNASLAEEATKTNDAISIEKIPSLIQNKEYDKALVFIEESMKTNQNDVNLLLYKAIINHQKGQFDLALIDYFKLTHFEPDNAMANYNLGLLFQEMNNNHKAIEFYEKVIKLQPDFTRVYFNIARANQEIGKNEKAIEYYKKYLDSSPDDIEAINNLAVAYKDENNHLKAIELFKQVLELKPDYAAGHYNLGIINLLKGNITETNNELKILKKLSPNHAKILEYQIKRFKINR